MQKTTIGLSLIKWFIKYENRVYSLFNLIYLVLRVL